MIGFITILVFANNTNVDGWKIVTSVELEERENFILQEYPVGGKLIDFRSGDK